MEEEYLYENCPSCLYRRGDDTNRCDFCEDEDQYEEDDVPDGFEPLESKRIIKIREAA